MTCPVCEGKGYIQSEKRHPQPKEPRKCICCHGTGEAQEFEGSKQIIKLYKAHGIYGEQELEYNFSQQTRQAS